jgi:protein-tyrosine-phosphatase
MDFYGGSMSWMNDIEKIQAAQVKSILFLCVANSARSQMAEGIARTFAPSNVQISSAGSKPTFVNPLAIESLAEIGIDISAHRSKDVSEFSPGSADVVITLCDDELCPVFKPEVLRFHWGMKDPAGGGIEEFRLVRDELLKRMRHLFS